jgi:hypothetical protein
VSAAIDTTDHSVYLSAWFGIALKSLSHLFFNFFTLFLDDQFFDLNCLSYTPFIPHSAVISNLSENQLYADDTQLFLHHSLLLTLLKILLTLNKLYLVSTIGCHLTFFLLSIPLKLLACSSTVTAYHTHADSIVSCSIETRSAQPLIETCMKSCNMFAHFAIVTFSTVYKIYALPNFTRLQYQLYV